MKSNFKITTINSEVLDALSSIAEKMDRKRMHLDLRNSDADFSQRMLNSLEPGTILPIHRHRNSSETVIVLRGKIEQRFYDGAGNLTDAIVVAPGSDIVGINVPAGQWHNTVCLEPGTVIFEAKDGKYEPLSELDILNL